MSGNSRDQQNQLLSGLPIEDIYQKLTHNLQSGYALHRIVLDQTGKPVNYIFLDINKRFEYFTGLKREDLIGKRVLEVLPGLNDDDFDWIGTYGAIALGDRPASQFTQYSEPLQRAYSIKAFSPQKMYFCALFDEILDESSVQDETIRAKISSTIRRQREIAERVMETSPIGITVLNEDGRIILANKRAEEILGLMHSTIKERTYNDPKWKIENFEGGPFPNEELPFDIVKRTKRPVYQVEHAIRWPNGQRVFLSINAAPLLDEEENFEGMVANIEDITEKWRQNQEILKSQKLESLGILAGGIAHDFNNLLTAILGNLSYIQATATCVEPDECYDILAEVERSSMRAVGLTRQLLSFAKGGAPVTKIVDLSGTIHDAVSFSLRGTKVKWAFDIPADLWDVNVDETQIAQVLQNISINAVQAMENGGDLFVSARNLTEGEVPLNLIPRSRYIELSIRDTGPGISPEIQDQVFDPYFTTKKKGSGLGLFVAYSIVKKHGGDILLESQLGLGATFRIYLPTSIGEENELSSETLTTGRGRGIVVVLDDEEPIRVVLSRMLTHLGYSPELAENGETLLQLVERLKKDGKNVEYAILDLTIPGGLGGKDVIGGLLELYPDLKAIVSSGYSNEPIIQNYQNYGFKGVLTKPFTISNLERVLHKVKKKG